MKKKKTKRLTKYRSIIKNAKLEEGTPEQKIYSNKQKEQHTEIRTNII